MEVPPHIFMLGNVPHDWLFSEERVSAVVHHGGAGTMAIGLAKGRPTVVVPFFGDQGFWGGSVPFWRVYSLNKSFRAHGAQSRGGSETYPPTRSLGQEVGFRHQVCFEPFGEGGCR